MKYLRVLPWVMIIAGIIGFILGAADILNLSGKLAAEVPSAMLALLGVIAQYLFFERLQIEEVRKENSDSFNQIMHRLSEASADADGVLAELREGVIGLRGEMLRLSPLQVLTSGTDIYDAARRLVNLANSELRSTSCGFSDEISFEPYIKAIAARARSERDAGRDFTYVTVFGGDLSETKSQNKVRMRTDAFEEAGVRERLVMRRLKKSASLGIDLLVVDNDHLLISFLSLDKKLRNGLVVERSPDFVKSVVSWYDKTLWSTMSETYAP